MDDMAVMRLLRADIDNVLHTLSPRECGVLRMRYGLDDGREKTLEEVGARYKVCLQVCQICLLHADCCMLMAMMWGAELLQLGCESAFCHRCKACLLRQLAAATSTGRLFEESHNTAS